jgi:hypothetical protein
VTFAGSGGGDAGFGDYRSFYGGHRAGCACREVDWE